MGQEARGRARIDSGGFPIPHRAHVLKIALVHLSKIEKKGHSCTERAWDQDIL